MSVRANSSIKSVKPETLIFGMLVLVAFGVLFFLTAQRQQALRASPVGFDGLHIWLAHSDLPAQTFTGGWAVDLASVDALVLPLFDTRLDRARVRPQSKEELLFQQDETDQRKDVLREKAAMVPSLLILPKWRSGMRLTGLSHPALLVEEEGLAAALRGLTGEEMRVGRIAVPFTDFDYIGPNEKRLRARLYVAQVFDGVGCEPVIGTRGQMVLGSCPIEGSDRRVLLLSDPDLFNNHGLRLGDNAEIARALFSTFADQGQILIDYSDGNWIVDRTAIPARGRRWSDLARFFEPPFSAMWVSAALVLALLLWRAGLRYGPVMQEQSEIEASKLQAIAAQARLLRLTGQDGALLADYVQARLASVAFRLFGPTGTRASGDREALLRHTGRHHPEMATHLQTALATIDGLPARLPARDAITHVDALETILETITHDT
ncbi:MAG: hypothetical protein AAGD04_17225 [Pseudomonadota bacterium]